MLLTPSSTSAVPLAPSTSTTRLNVPKSSKVPAVGSAEEALEAAKKRLERMARHKKKDALGDIGNRRRATVGEWSAQAQVDEILRKAKQRTAAYAKPRGL